MFWSISVPIGLTEGLFAGRRDTPWLGKIGIAIFAILMLIGGAAIAFFTNKQAPFMAAPAQLGGAAAVVLVLTIAAFLLPKRSAPGEGRAPPAAVLFLVALACGSAFVALEFWGPKLNLGWEAVAELLLGFELIFCSSSLPSLRAAFGPTVSAWR